MTELESIDSMKGHTNLPWNKLEKTFKLEKLYEFAETCAQERSLPSETLAELKKTFREKINRKQLQKSKDVVYNKDEAKIVSIPHLQFNTTGFVFRNLDAVSPLLSLAPKNKTVKKLASNS